MQFSLNVLQFVDHSSKTARQTVVYYQLKLRALSCLDSVKFYDVAKAEILSIIQKYTDLNIGFQSLASILFNFGESCLLMINTGKLSKFKFIVEHYVKTWVFACDILSSLPIEVFALIWSTDFTQRYAFGILKLNRLLKFYRVSPFSMIEPSDWFLFCFVLSCYIVYLQFVHNSLCLFHYVKDLHGKWLELIFSI